MIYYKFIVTDTLVKKTKKKNAVKKKLTWIPWLIKKFRNMKNDSRSLKEKKEANHKKNARGNHLFKKIIWLENLKNIPHYVVGWVNNFYNCLD